MAHEPITSESGALPDGVNEPIGTSRARLIAAAPDLLAELRALAHLSDVLNSRQHAGLSITPTMWAELFQITNRSAGVIAKAEERE